MWRQLQRESIEVARCTVEHLMRVEGLIGAERVLETAITSGVG